MNRLLTIHKTSSLIFPEKRIIICIKKRLSSATDLLGNNITTYHTLFKSHFHMHKKSRRTIWKSWEVIKFECAVQYLCTLSKSKTIYIFYTRLYKRLFSSIGIRTGFSSNFNNMDYLSQESRSFFFPASSMPLVLTYCELSSKCTRK